LEPQTSLSLLEVLRQDRLANRFDPKGRLIVQLFRLANLCVTKKHDSNPLWKLGLLYRAFYRYFVIWLLGVELQEAVMAGPGLQVHHGIGLVVNPRAVLGKNCILRHNTTIGSKTLPNGSEGASPVLGDFVDVGAHSVILGDISIGDHAIVGAGSVVIHSVPAGAVVVGNPARVVRYLPSFDPTRPA
jgi:putative colanic acid biosynthesis acetyltransferase WcaB